MIKLYLIDIRKFNDRELLKKALLNSSDFRREKYNSYKNDEARLQCVAATYIIDKYLQEQNLREKDMVYKLTKLGKPYFESHQDIYFSISHSKNVSAVAFCDKEVGCDVQIVKKISKNIYDKVLSDKEKKMILDIKDENAKIDKFFENWTIKEAIIKRDGTGLAIDLKNVYDEYAYVDKIILYNDLYFISVNNGTYDKIEKFYI